MNMNLTEKEKEVAQYVYDGYTSRDISAIIGTSVRTVEAHRRTIYMKMGCDTVVEFCRKFMYSELKEKFAKELDMYRLHEDNHKLIIKLSEKILSGVRLV